MHLLMGLIMGSQDTGNWVEHFEVFSELLLGSVTHITSGLSTVDLLEHTTVQPLELVFLLSLKLIQDSTDGKTDLIENYVKYVGDLVSNQV